MARRPLQRTPALMEPREPGSSRDSLPKPGFTLVLGYPLGSNFRYSEMFALGSMVASVFSGSLKALIAELPPEM